MILPRQFQGTDIAGGQQCFFVEAAALPHGSHRMDDIFCGQVETGREFCFAGRTAAQGFAEGVELFRASRRVDGSVHTAAAPQFVIGCVDDGIHFQFGNVAADKCYRHSVTPYVTNSPCLTK